MAAQHNNTTFNIPFNIDTNDPFLQYNTYGGVFQMKTDGSYPKL